MIKLWEFYQMFVNYLFEDKINQQNDISATQPNLDDGNNPEISHCNEKVWSDDHKSPR